jgi:hypothetical protein
MRLALCALVLLFQAAPGIAASASRSSDILVHLCSEAGGASISWSDLTGEKPGPKQSPYKCPACVAAASNCVLPVASWQRALVDPVWIALTPSPAPLLAAPFLRPSPFSSRAPPFAT